MSAQYKRVRKQFDYMHCDDFAAYLSEMAAKGWHFKLWERNLVFEKGEPAEVTYAVEIFREARDSAFKPDPSIFEFSEMCEAAGWQFVDSKRKFCVLRKISPEAMPLFTPEERLQNALKEEYRIGGMFSLLLVLLAFGFWMGFHINGNIVGKIFSAEALMRDVVWWILILTQVWYYGYGLFCKKRYLRDIEKGKELYIGSRKRKAVYVWFYDIAVAASAVTLIICQWWAGEMEEVVYYSIALTIMALFRFLFLRNTEQSTHYFYGMLLVSVFFFITMAPEFLYTNARWYKLFETKADWREIRREIPLEVTDYREIPLEMVEIDLRKDCSIFGKYEKYTLWFKVSESRSSGVAYDIYVSRSDKILNRFWDELLNMWGVYAPLTECSEEWEAVEAFRNEKGIYFVRYDNCIFLLRDWDGISLDASQIAIIRHKMDLK